MDGRGACQGSIGVRDNAPSPFVFAIVRELEPALKRRGWHVALTGGVLQTGASTKDLDLVLYPRDSTCVSLKRLESALQRAGWHRTHTAERMRLGWRIRGSRDEKHVEVWRTGDGRRVDVIVPITESVP